MAISAIFPEGVFPAGLFAGFPEVDSSYPVIRYSWEENEMYEQFTGETVKWAFQVIDSSGAVVESLTAPVVNVRLNGETLSIQPWTISEFNSTMGTFLLEVPPTLDGVALDSGDLLEIAIVDAGVGRGHISIKFVSEISGGSGAEKIIPAANYAFDASAKTLTFSSPYDTLTVEQVTFIKNLTTNYIIWDCRYAGYQTLPIRFGAAPDTHVLSFDSSDSDAANTDKIMIVVNQV